MRALVTGGNGFLGGAIVRQLLARGDRVRSLARSEAPHLEALGVEARRGDVADRDAVMRAVDGCDVVFHVAALAGVFGAREAFVRTNVVGTINVIEACQKAGVGRLVYTSSPSVVFGGKSLEGVDERVPYPDSYLADYPRTKADAELRVLAAASSSLLTCSLRPHLIWGPGDQHLVPRIVARARAGKLRLVGDGRALVDTTYVDNAARAHLDAADHLIPGAPCVGKAYFITNGEPAPIGVIINRILDAAGLPPVTRHVPFRLAYAAGYASELAFRALRLDREPLMTRFLAEQLATAHWFDISAARRDLGYRPDITIDEGMKRLAAWFRQPSA